MHVIGVRAIGSVVKCGAISHFVYVRCRIGEVRVLLEPGQSTVSCVAESSADALTIHRAHTAAGLSVDGSVRMSSLC
jgi:hypothetical protein